MGEEGNGGVEVKMEDFTPEVLARYWSKVKIGGPSECWPWQGSKRNGYGRFRVGKKLKTTHRIALFLKIGDLQGKDVRHKECDNPPCCNPAHLEIGTDLDNVQDKIKHGRFRGRNGATIVTEEELTKLLTLISTRGIPRKKVCEMMGWTRQRLGYSMRLLKEQGRHKANWRSRQIFTDEQLLAMFKRAQEIPHINLAAELRIKLGTLRNILKKFRKAEREGADLLKYWKPPYTGNW